jgi:hypothetical protein
MSADGPSVGPTARQLGARREDDLPVDADGFVEPETGGVSVAPEAAKRLPIHRRPAEHGGDGRDPVWKLSVNALPDGLRYRPDEEDPENHGTIEPSRRMTFDEFQEKVAATQPSWTLVEA